MQTNAPTDIRDCWHDDITHIVNARGPARLDRKNTNRRKYEKMHKWTQPAHLTAKARYVS